ncbi:hypothetical protein EYR40_007355 [Pleurotus pulmonarius]|nr:hypothetical protein EYR40_007355 [Pleurotus pulmonarius]
MEETLLQHDQIERLVLHPNYNHLSLSPNDLPHLRYLSGSLKNIIRTLSGHRLTHLQTSFFDGGENLIRRGCLDNYTVKSLSCYSQDLQALGAFAEHLKNLECLELHRAGCVGDWWKGYQLRNNPLRFIRFAREMSGRGYGLDATIPPVLLIVRDKVLGTRLLASAVHANDGLVRALAGEEWIGAKALPKRVQSPDCASARVTPLNTTEKEKKR